MNEYQREKNKAEYFGRINRVIDFISQNLDKSLEHQQLADIAHFSRFHFHRVFSTIIALLSRKV